ncbi:hypothetical protein ACIBHX_48590 [Nonomuraea sp. NPDC050536]|uniref:hypothetical protein n=1 Tax=Nonomuraea sp. NPDC050536 TaxID=3364366 RepID=UPI0037C6ED95
MRRRIPALAAIALVVLGVIAVAVRLDAPSDGFLVRTEWSSWRADGVVAGRPQAAPVTT